ncbi:hypothetical protein IQ07DRAFT_524961 [Pyrenochaeta sp. DS3sAY3a]|nr:hypothetical protein IQ07DRAFT_524961 [Pyrenochaeta sp. DS3sAY3a]
MPSHSPSVPSLDPRLRVSISICVLVKPQLQLLTAITNAPIARSPTNLDARSGAILLEIGADGVNVGSIPRNVLYDDVYKALRFICPFGDAQQCTGKTTSFLVTQEWFGVPDVLNEVVIVEVAKAWWGTSGAIQSLMIGAIAGTFERGRDSAHNCRTVGKEERIIHCNAPNYAAIHFPGGYHMQVHFRNGPKSSFKGKYECNTMITEATTYVDSLQEEIEKELNDGDLYVVGRCM